MTRASNVVKKRLTALVAAIAVRRPDPAQVADYRALVETLTDTALFRPILEHHFPDPDLSLPILERLARVHPADPDPRLQAGWVLWGVGRFDEARVALNEAVQLGISRVEALLLEAALARSEPDQLRLYRIVLELEPTNEIAHGQVDDLERRGVR